MNPLKAIINAVRPEAPRMSGGAGPLPNNFRRLHPGAPATLTPEQAAEMTVSPRLPDPGSLASMPGWHGQFIDLKKISPFVTRRHGEIFTKAELETLAGLQEQYERLTDLITRLSVSAVKTEFMRQRADLAGLASSGDGNATGRILTMELADKNTLANEIGEKRSSLKRQRNVICREALSVTLSAGAKLAETCELIGSEFEAEERKRAFEFGTSYKQSDIVCGILQMSWVPLRELKDRPWASPAQQCALFNVELDSPGLRAVKKEREVEQRAVEKSILESERRERAAAEKSAKVNADDRARRLEVWQNFVCAKAQEEVGLLGERASDEAKRVAAGDFSSPQMKHAIAHFK